MKRLTLIILCIWVGIIGAVTQQNEPQSLNQSFQILAKTSTSMRISFSPGAYSIQEEMIAGKTFHHIDMPGASSTIDEGMPELPILSTSVIIPAHGSVSIRTTNTSVRNLGTYNPYPVQQRLDLESPKSFVMDEAFYTGSQAYPSTMMSYSEPVIMRDFRIVSMQVCPFYYNPSSGELGLYESVEFELEFNETPGMNELASEPSYVSPAFDKLYSATLLNYNDYRWMVPVNTPPRYLLIHGNNSDPAFTTAINDFVLWKRQKGAEVTVASTSVAGSSTSAIKTYIQGQYNNTATRPDYIIFIGDTTGSFIIPTFNENGGPGDYPYTHLSGGDGVGDVYIGRISVENISQLLVVLNKVYLYERDINIDTASWLNKMLLAADWAPSGISTVYMSKYLKETSHLINPEYTYTEVYGDGSLGTQIQAAVNQGVGFYNFRGYIDLAGWDPAGSYFNGYKTPHTWMLTCGTGNIDGSTPAKTESFYRAGTVAAPAGAVTTVGMATSSTHTTFNNSLNGGMIHGVTQAGMRTMGEALLAGKVNIYRIFSVSSPTNAAKFAQWCNLIGDPTMEVFMKIPGQFQVTVNQSIPLGLSLLDIAVADINGIVEGACVTLTQSGQVISRGYTDAEGNVILVLPEAMTAGTAVITVSAHEYKPSQITITVTDTPTLVPGVVMLDDDNSGASQGNTNGTANPGEIIEISFGLENTGTASIANITGYATTSSPYVNFVDSLVVYNTIAGGALGFSEDPIVFTVAPNTPYGTMLRFHLILTDGSQVEYDVSEFVPVEAARFSFNTTGVLDGGNNALDPGETASFTVGINNIGPLAVDNLFGRLYTLNDLVIINDNIGSFGNVPVEGTATCTDDTFTLTAREQSLPGMPIPMRLKLYNDQGFEQYLDFSLTIGVVGVQDPLGPCEYGYVIFDDGDWSYAEAPTFQWVGIAPAEGGLGTLLPLSDSWVSNNEGDQVGSTAITTIDLPFPFQFYGIVYTRASISSNGFIVMGESSNAEFRNFRLPGPMGASPMIAPFWDDLATHTAGGVYTWYDRSNSAFVVEWYNMRNGNNGTSPETFQAILYDQAVYPTSFGDGPIKFQYQTFNNVDTQGSSSNRHGSYASIGIEDHTGTRGLEYSFNNLYPTAASPLGNQRALYITNVPVYHMEAQVILAQTFIDDSQGNGNNIAEPGETVQLGVQLSNIGNAPASGIVATLSSTDPNINILTAVSEYYPLEAEGTGVNRVAFVFQVAENCPDGHVAEFTLNIVSGEQTWTRQFSVRIDASLLSMHSFLIDDSEATHNGIIDINETVNLVVNIKNPSSVEARDVVGTLSTTFPGVTIINPQISVAKIESNTVMQFVYQVSLSGENGAGTFLPFTFDTVSSNAQEFETMVYVPYNITNEFNDLEYSGAGFNVESGWVWGNPNQVTPYSGSKLWATTLSGSYPDYIDYNLFTPTYLLTQNSVLNFKHYYSVEAGYDGGNVSISTNGGESWTLLQPQGGYTHNNLTGLGGQSGFSGSSGGWQNALFNLDQYSGQNVIFKFRFGSDGATGGLGWFIDDFNLSGLDKRIGQLHGIVIPTSEFSPSLSTVKASNMFVTNPGTDGSFKLYLPRGSYNAEASMKHHQSASFGPFALTGDELARYTEFTLIYLPKPQTVAYTYSNETQIFNMSWTEPFDPVLPVVTYRVYKRFDTGVFQPIFETSETSYSELLTLDGNYQYYVRVKYINVEGSPSDTLSFSLPYVVDNEDIQSPALTTSLYANYPNPFNPTTTIAFDLSQSGPVSLRIFNMRGQLVRTLVDANRTTGRHSVVWDGRDSANRVVSSGLYFYRLDTKDYSKTRRMLMVK